MCAQKVDEKELKDFLKIVVHNILVHEGRKNGDTQMAQLVVDKIRNDMGEAYYNRMSAFFCGFHDEIHSALE